MSEIENHLATLRRKRGITAVRLAEAAGVSRQTIYAIEAGTYIPNTAVALRLGQALSAGVEELFTLPASVPAVRKEAVTLLAGPAAPKPGQPVQLCRVDKALIAAAPSPIPWYFPTADAVIAEGGRSEAQIFESEEDFTNRILIAGCDPAISVLARHATGAELILANRNSSQSLALLKEGLVHVAGTHLRDEATGESNLPAIARLFPKNSVAVISFAIQEEGIVTARGNPKEIRGVEDVARKDVSIVNREKGAASRVLLDAGLKQAGLSAKKVRGYETEAAGHLAAAWQVQSGSADCCIATRAAARVFGLGFVPLLTERYDLVVRRRHLELPRMQNLFDTLGRAAFRRELAGLGGYDTKITGDRLM